MTEQKIRIGIVGARAYTARELLLILARHPRAQVAVLQARVDDPVPPGDVFGVLRGMDLPDIVDVDFSHLPADLNAVFLCLPHTAAAEYAVPLMERGLRVIDLSADFRYGSLKTYESVYGVTHPAPELMAKAVYGLPEIRRASIIGAPLIANPGCYPTAVILSLAPLMKRDLVVPGTIIADCKSGVSGAGRTANDVTHFCGANESLKAYKVAEHRHESEIEEQVSRLAGETHTVTFVPHLVPMDRGEYATVYAKLKEPMTADNVRRMFASYYENEPFIRLMPGSALPDTKNVANTNFADIAVRVDERKQRLIVTTAIDNLVKGASGQAVQNFNISYGLPETMGLV